MKVLILTSGNSTSASGQRARLLFANIACQIIYEHRSSRKFASLLRFVRTVLVERPTVIYVVDTVWASVLAALVGKLVVHSRFVLDTGDAAYALARSLGRVSRLSCIGVGLVERAALQGANDIIVRGRYHGLYLRDRGFSNVVEIPDCVSLDRPPDAQLDGQALELRRSLGLMDVLTVGMVGSCHWSPRLKRATYGWDLVEAMSRLRQLPIHALLIIDGDGVSHLRRRISELGLEQRFTIVGPVRPEKIDVYIRIVDVCLSTQTDDLVGWVRTTGKLPLYLINGRFVLATDVGQASWVLPNEMRLPYHGVVDREYPQRLAARLAEIGEHRAILSLGRRGPELVKNHFDAQRMQARLAEHFDLHVDLPAPEASPALVPS